MLRRIVWFGCGGAVAGVLTVLFSGVTAITGMVIDFFFSGIFFAAILTLVTAAQSRPSGGVHAPLLRYCLAAAVLAVSPPCALLLAAGIQRMARMNPNEPTGFLMSFVLPASAAIFLWALCLALFSAVVTQRWRTRRLLQSTVIGLCIFLFIVAVDSVTRNVWGKSVFVHLFIVGEEIGSAIFLAVATQNLDTPL